MPLISVLIPTFNRPEQLRVALESALHLGDDLEIIIGNNGEANSVVDVVASNPRLISLKLIQNPPGSSYPFNLNVLISKATGQWITILHDDDFFTEEAIIMPEVLRNNTDVDFIFSDHWVADQAGTILKSETDANTENYGRTKLAPGKIVGWQVHAAAQAVCMDCFFVRTELAKQCFVDTSLSYFADTFLLAQFAALGPKAIYMSERLFAYRLSTSGLTTAGIPQDELLSVLLRTLSFTTDAEALAALKRRIKWQASTSLKYSLKRGKVRSAVEALVAIVGLS
jgi:glycosyltransferase involved in cell wall biosynthesis